MFFLINPFNIVTPPTCWSFRFLLLKVGGGGGGFVAKSSWILGTPWTEAHQAPLSMGFPRQEYWSHFLLQGIFPSQGLNLGILHCRQILYHCATRVQSSGKHHFYVNYTIEPCN